MTNKSVRSFDSFLNEHRAKKVRKERFIEVYGKEYQISPILPADLVLRIQRLQRLYGADGNVPSSEVLEIADRLFPEGVLDQISKDADLDVDELGKLIEFVMQSYMEDEEAAAEDEVEENPTNPAGEPVGISSMNGNT